MYQSTSYCRVSFNSVLTSTAPPTVTGPLPMLLQFRDVSCSVAEDIPVVGTFDAYRNPTPAQPLIDNFKRQPALALVPASRRCTNMNGSLKTFAQKWKLHAHCTRSLDSKLIPVECCMLSIWRGTLDRKESIYIVLHISYGNDNPDGSRLRSPTDDYP